MKKIAFILLTFASTCQAYAQGLAYYLPDSVSYNPGVPKPSEIIYHEVGEWHVTHDRLVNYMKAIAASAPERVKLETMGMTYENRPQVILIITSRKNHENLEQIRQQHLKLSDPSVSSSLDIGNMPIVVWIGHSIHGNEASGSNASLLSAYYLAAAQSKQIDDLLDNVVILFDPSFNPDGLQRFSTWANQHKSKNLVSDSNSREFKEVWPGGRFNHYWFDLNRDWLPAVHLESQNRLEWFHKWKPNILTDHHEQSSNATFFFQPGVPSRVNPLTPAKNQDLTGKLGEFHARFLDRIGSLYFTRENYDDFYYGKGSTYPDINGAIGILFEQASSRGHLQETANGFLSFPFTIRNQFVTTLSTLEGANALRKEFLSYQRDFYKNVEKEVAALPVKAYLFGKTGDNKTLSEFINLLKRHQVEMFRMSGPLSIAGHTYASENSYVVPLSQPQSKVIRTIFEKTLQFKDSLFYDITAWTLPLAFGIPSAELNNAQLSQLKLVRVTDAVGLKQNVLTSPSNYAYLVRWSDMESPAALYELLQKNIHAKVATRKFAINRNGINQEYGAGTILIPVQMQKIGRDELFRILKQVAEKYTIGIDALESGSASSGVDIGSSRFINLQQPVVAMIAGQGVDPLNAGEVWHLLDQRMNIPLTHLEPRIFNRIDLNKYNTLIMVGGSYSELNRDKLKAWVMAGGTLILTEEAVKWSAENGISTVKFKMAKSPVDSLMHLDYTDREQVIGAQLVRGAIFSAEADLSHPLAFGYNDSKVSFF
ncbi:MAG TPA: M14 metallopeptidase family protein, partial [Chitinophagaceae bacterium]|nr:M14 metallopeptidase family protein [Chitinophagaceae bacterium]